MDYTPKFSEGDSLKDKAKFLSNKTKLMTLEEETLTSMVCQSFNVKDLIRPCRLRPNVDSRRVYARILKDRGWNLCEIGRSLKRDHSTIHHYLKDFDWFLMHDAKVRDIYYSIKENLDRMLLTDPLYGLNDEELIQQIYALKDEKKFLVAALKQVQSELDKEKKYGDIFASICERVPSHRIDEFSIKLNRILNGM